MTDKLYFCPECGAMVKLEMGRHHLKWHADLDTILESIIVKSKAPVLQLVKETNNETEEG